MPRLALSRSASRGIRRALAGQPFIVRDSDGNVLVRDRGVIRQVIQFDTLGDDVPGGEFIADVSFSVSGPHPGLEFDLCTMLD